LTVMALLMTNRPIGGLLVVERCASHAVQARAHHRTNLSRHPELAEWA
jgi:hypothetical protein